LDFLLPFFLGFVIAVIGILPPGLINMTAAKVSVVDGRNEAISFVIGATVIVCLSLKDASPGKTPGNDNAH
jgi:threonine/homoserine/homoserine lactone efflux protein